MPLSAIVVAQSHWPKNSASLFALYGEQQFSTIPVKASFCARPNKTMCSRWDLSPLSTCMCYEQLIPFLDAIFVSLCYI